MHLLENAKRQNNNQKQKCEYYVCKIIFQALIKFIMGALLTGVMVFLPAGTFEFLNGWLFIILLFVPMFIEGMVLMIKNPELLSKRLNANEEPKEQKLVIALSGLIFICGFVISGLNVRFSWLTMPRWTVIVASILIILSYIMYGEVLKEDTYLSFTVEVQENQMVK